MPSRWYQCVWLTQTYRVRCRQWCCRSSTIVCAGKFHRGKLSTKQKISNSFRILYLRKRIPRKLLASSRLILLCDIFSRRSTEFRANVPRVISPMALCDTLQKLSFVRPAMCDESNFVIRLWLMSSDSRSRKFLNWFFFRVVTLLPWKSSDFNLRSDCTNSTGISDTFPLEMCNRSSRWLAGLLANESTSNVEILWLFSTSDVNLLRIYGKFGAKSHGWETMDAIMHELMRMVWIACVCLVFTHFDRLRKCSQSWIVYLELF